MGVVVLALAIAVIVAAGGYALSTKPIEPKLSHINPLAGIGRLFSKQQLVETATLAFITGERVDVVVKNVSDTGARVEFMRDIQLPDRVLLSEPTLRLKTWAYVIWQTRGAAGLQFVKT